MMRSFNCIKVSISNLSEATKNVIYEYAMKTRVFAAIYLVWFFTAFIGEHFDFPFVWYAATVFYLVTHIWVISVPIFCIIWIRPFRERTGSRFVKYFAVPFTALMLCLLIMNGMWGMLDLIFKTHIIDNHNICLKEVFKEIAELRDSDFIDAVRETLSNYFR